MQVLKSFLELFKRKTQRPREVLFLEYDEAERLLLANPDWHLAPEEDTNCMFGHVYLQRFI
jgi:hypothetical protein